jgi:hypothetical protein
VSVLLAALVALVALVGSTWLATTPAAAESTGGCRPIGGSATSTGGPHRATVVVDPGSGPVWSACISFSGTISGLDALELAAATIPGLDPVYEPYPGQGRAVCRLLGVGNDPPNCLSKSVAYWSYFRNGAYSRGGGGASVVTDGDVEGWAFTTGAAPRAATYGTEAVPASAVPTTAPTTTPPPAPVPPGPAPAEPVPPGGATPTAEVGAGSPGPTTTVATAVASPAPGADPAGRPAASAGPAAGGVVGDDDDPPSPGGPEGATSDESAGASPGGVTVTRADGDGDSSLGSILGFGSALGALGVAAVVVRRRRDGQRAAGPAPLLHEG